MDNLNTTDFVKTVNSLRLANKNKWYVWTGLVNGKMIQIKAYATWLQIFMVDNLNVPTCSDISATEFKKVLSDNV